MRFLAYSRISSDTACRWNIDLKLFGIVDIANNELSIIWEEVGKNVNIHQQLTHNLPQQAVVKVSVSVYLLIFDIYLI